MSRAFYAATPEPPPARELSLSPAKIAAAMRAVFRATGLWRLTNEQTRILLGRPARSTFYKWKSGHVAAVPYDTVRRLSYLLGIYKALQILFESSEQADSWVRRPNRDLGGGSALDRMLGGDVTDLAAVRTYLDVVRGQGG